MVGNKPPPKLRNLKEKWRLVTVHDPQTEGRLVRLLTASLSWRTLSSGSMWVGNLGEGKEGGRTVQGLAKLLEVLGVKAHSP